MIKEKKKLNKKHLIAALAVLLLAIVLGWFGYPFVRLMPLGYPAEAIISIGQKNLVSQFADEEYSPLLVYALKQDKNNLNDYQYYLVKTSDYPAGYSSAEFYELIKQVKEKGYTASEAKELYPLLNSHSWETLLSLDKPAYPETFIEAYSNGYSFDNSYTLASLDSELAKLVMDNSLDPQLIITLSTKGYTTDEIKTLSSTLDAGQLETTSEMKYFKDLPSLVATSSFDFKRLARYLMQLDQGKTVPEAVAYINNDGDYVAEENIDWSAYYSDSQPTPDPSSLTALVNKKYYLTSDYVPSDLEYLPQGYYVNNHPMRTEAKNAVIALSDAAVNAGYGKIKAQSNYRSYNLQAGLYSDYVAQSGVALADKFSARPGYSEHQTGLVSDLSGSGRDMLYFDEYNGYSWVLEHAHEYGFIQRYPLYKEYLTGYEFESWHFRYVGVKPATIMYTYSWTLEEYSYLFE